MLIQFTVGNYMSFREKSTLSMVKSAMHELPDNVIKVDDDLSLLKSVVIYGANASGKSNFLQAFSFMKTFVLLSFKAWELDEKIGISNFVLNNESKERPTFFEVILLINKITYRYGFEADNKRVQKEWLYYTPRNKELNLFNRIGKDFIIGDDFSEGNDLQDKTRENCLFLTVASAFNGTIASTVLQEFKQISFSYYPKTETVISRLEEDPHLKNEIMKFIKIADSTVQDFEITSIPSNPSNPIGLLALNRKKESTQKITNFFHNVYDEKNGVVGSEKLQLDIHESSGTRKMFALSVLIIDALQKGGVLIIDELENHLHTSLFQYVIKLFNSSANHNNSQLIFTTHNLSCMRNECFRRDQIWFSDKNSFGESTLFSLADYKFNEKKIRNDASYSKDYLLGKYGAVPFIDDIALTFNKTTNG